MSANDDDDGFFSRWSRRKAQAQRGDAPADAAPPAAAQAPAVPQPVAAPATATPAAVPPAPAEPAAPLPTLDDVARLTPDADFSRFVARGVDEGVKRAAMKKLFSDPRFNVMDGLDVYIDDYNVTTPIPPAELRQLAQARALGLFDDEEEMQEPQRAAAEAAVAAPGGPEVAPDGAPAAPLSQSASAAPDAARADTPPIADEDPDLRLQPYDAARRPGPDAGAGRERG